MKDQLAALALEIADKRMVIARLSARITELEAELAARLEAELAARLEAERA